MTRRKQATAADLRAGMARISSISAAITRHDYDVVDRLNGYSGGTGAEAMDVLTAVREAHDQIDQLIWELLAAVAQTGTSIATISARTGIPARTLSRHLGRGA